MAGFGFGFGADFAGVARATGGAGAGTAAVSPRAMVSGAAEAAVSDPATTEVSPADAAPDRRSPPHPATVATESKQTARSGIIISSTLSFGDRGLTTPGTKIVSLPRMLGDAGHALR